MSHEPAPAPAPAPAKIELDGELAAAYLEFRDAAAELDGAFRRYTLAKERHMAALAQLTRLAVQTH